MGRVAASAARLVCRFSTKIPGGGSTDTNVVPPHSGSASFHRNQPNNLTCPSPTNRNSPITGRSWSPERRVSGPPPCDPPSTISSLRHRHRHRNFGFAPATHTYPLAQTHARRYLNVNTPSLPSHIKSNRPRDCHTFPVFETGTISSTRNRMSKRR
jgi:hypothetical protein